MCASVYSEIWFGARRVYKKVDRSRSSSSLLESLVDPASVLVSCELVGGLSSGTCKPYLNIGGQVARIGLAFGMKIIAWSQNMTSEVAEAAGATMVSKDELFRQADIVSIQFILSPRTRRASSEPLNLR